MAMLDNSSRKARVYALGVCLLLVVACGLAVVSEAAADEWNKKTIVTFSSPVEIPGGKVLPAGTYVFKLLDSVGNRNIVQIFDKDEKQLYATILAIPDYRLRPADKPVLYFQERPSGEPVALKAFFYPGDQYGEEFVYPHQQATQLAKANHQNVLSMSDEMKSNIAAPAQSAQAQSVQGLERTPVTGVNPVGEEVELDIVVLPPPKNGNR